MSFRYIRPPGGCPGGLLFLNYLSTLGEGGEVNDQHKDISEEFYCACFINSGPSD
jgi:hypothetical protein